VKSPTHEASNQIITANCLIALTNTKKNKLTYWGKVNSSLLARQSIFLIEKKTIVFKNIFLV